MIVFHNLGLIDLAAVRTMGVSVKRPGSFGFFGTGLKFAIASVLRGGGRITLWRGTEGHHFSTREQVIRGETFNLVLLDGEPMGFTDQLGKNWEPWMVLRELGCNAKDEGGDFEMTVEPDRLDDVPHPDGTTFVVNWEALETAYKDRGTVFCEAEVLFQTQHLQVLAGGSSPYLFYRGVRAYKLEKPSRFTYNILEAQSLTEDRTLASRYWADQRIVEALLKCEDRTVLDGALTVGKGWHEGTLDFAHEQVEPSKAFIDTVLDAKDRRDGGLSESARAVLSKHMRKALDESRVSGGFYRGREDNFTVAICALKDLGIDLQDQAVIVVDELTGSARSLLEDGRVYLLRSLMDESPRIIATELAERYLEKECYGRDDTADLLLPLLFERHRALRNEKDEDEPGVSLSYTLRKDAEEPAPFPAAAAPEGPLEDGVMEF